MGLSDPIAKLRAKLDALERAYSPGHHGRWAARRRAELYDDALALLYARAGAPPGVALVAVGGYGRAQMLPRSDLDLLILHEPGEDPAVFADAILYPLWDGGVDVGHAVRTIEDCVAAAAADLDARTAMLDGRLVAGSADLCARALAAVRGPIEADVAGFVASLRRDRAERRERAGSAAHLLEPDLKQGTGGMRDVHVLRWLSEALGAPSVDASLLRERERRAADAAEEFLVRVRSAVHLQTGRRSDRLLLDLQPDVARAMGFGDEPRLIATDGLMRAVFEHARQVDHVVGLVLDRFETVSALEPAPELRGPATVLEALADVAEAGGVASARLLDAVEGADVPDPVAWDDAVREGFLRILRAAASDGARALETLDRLGLLVRFIPEWADVRCRPQRDPYHRLSVDAHLAGTLAAIARVLGAGGAEDPIDREAVNLIGDRDALLLGALLHDVGKIGAGNHVPIGAEIADRALARMRVRPHTRDLATFMVAEHLLLPDTATRRDLSDEDLILDVASRVRTPERLAALYLLAGADALSTGPAAWTPWRRTLIRELVAKVQRVLERGEMGEELAGRLAERIDRLRDLLAGEPDEHVDRFVLRMPRGYFLAIEPAQAARHFATVSPSLGSMEVRTAAIEGIRPGTYQVLVVAADRPGLLSWIAGAFALGGISILSAQVFTTEDGVGVDVFEVEGAFEPVIDERRWREFRSALRQAIEGSISLERRVDEKRRHYPDPSRDVPLTIAVDNHVSDFSTVVEVGAADRLGLLHDITRALADLKLDVHVAKVATYEGRVIDAFYVRDALGQKITVDDRVAEMEAAIRLAIAPASSNQIPS